MLTVSDKVNPAVCEIKNGCKGTRERCLIPVDF